MYDFRKSHHGFTIVELLIVIVVIAILATISVIIYNGIQNRANLSKGSSAVNGFVNILELYYADNGSYPHPGGSGHACVGSTADYPIAPGFAAGQCDNHPAGSVSVSAQLNTALAPYAARLPDGSLPPQTWGDDNSYGSLRGVEYDYISARSAGITYRVGGQQSCPRGTTTPIHNNKDTDCYLYIRH